MESWTLTHYLLSGPVARLSRLPSPPIQLLVSIQQDASSPNKCNHSRCPCTVPVHPVMDAVGQSAS